MVAACRPFAVRDVLYPAAGYIRIHDAGLARIYGNRYAGSVGYEYEGQPHVCWSYLHAAPLAVRDERDDADPGRVQDGNDLQAG